MVSEAELGKLEQVDVRRAWRHEAYNFTPWLAENLDRLAAEIGVELELEGTELKVGPYQADIVARFPRDDSACSSKTSWRKPISSISGRSWLI